MGGYDNIVAKFMLARAGLLYRALELAISADNCIIPQEDIIRRYYRSKNLFYNTYKDLVDEWAIYYNSNEIFEEIANNDEICDNEFKSELINDLCLCISRLKYFILQTTEIIEEFVEITDEIKEKKKRN